MYIKEKQLSPYDAWYLNHRHPFGDRPLVDLTDSSRQHSFLLSPLAGAGYHHSFFPDSAYISAIGGVGLRVRGEIKSHVTFYSRGLVFTEKTDKEQFTHQFDPDQGETCAVEKGANDSLLDTRTCARFEYYLFIDLPWLEIKLGRDRLHMGPGYFSSLTANRETPPYYLIEARIDFSDWLFMDNYFLKMTDTEHDVRKYQHIHRFEFKPLKSLSIAFQDAVIYQERDPDLKYVLPLTPLAFSEDNNGGRDNDAMSLDFLYTGLPFFSVWGETFIDDLLGPGTFFDDFWENRWAVLAGLQLVSPWPAADADVAVEYSRVEPWTYNGRQRYTSFKHFNVPSASKLGPDSRSIDVQVSYRPLPWLQIQERMQFNDKGTQRGAVLANIHDNATDGTTKEFLKGDVNSSRIYTHSVSWFWSRYLLGELQWKHVRGDSDYSELGAKLDFSW
jgi:hypothetical protein